MESPNRIAVLTAYSDSLLTIKAFLADELGRAPPQHDEGEPNQTAQLVLSLDNPPKRREHGFVFGTDESCDVRLITDNEQNHKIRPRHFAITFDPQGHLILKTLELGHATVGYPDQEDTAKQLRWNFTWHLFPDQKVFQVSIPGSDVGFKLELADHSHNMEAHLQQLAIFLGVRRDALDTAYSGPFAVPEYRALNKEKIPPSRFQRRIFLFGNVLGAGASGEVSQIRDASSGETLAGKKFVMPDEGSWPPRTSEVDAFRSAADREILLARNLAHEHIVDFHGYHDHSDAIIMQLAPLGNVHSARTPSGRSQKFSEEEILTMLQQLLKALAYIREIGVVHRDIKPENILLMDRKMDGKNLTVKLADFGHAKVLDSARDPFASQGATVDFESPELFWRDRFSSPTDIWSLGVTAMEMWYGLPHGVVRDEEWHAACVAHISEKNRNPKATLPVLLSNMVQLNPKLRPTPELCLQLLEDAWTLEGPMDDNAATNAAIEGTQLHRMS